MTISEVDGAKRYEAFFTGIFWWDPICNSGITDDLFDQVFKQPGSSGNYNGASIERLSLNL